MANDGPFLFYSALHGRPVLDPDGARVGRLDDVAVTPTEAFPAATALLVRQGHVEVFRLTARWRDVESVDTPAVRLRVPVERLAPGRRLPSEPSFWVGQVLLDRQIVDTSGAKVVRVNDLHFLRVPTGDLRTQGLLHDGAHFCFVRLDAWRQPKGGGASPFSDVGCAMLESPAADSIDEPRHHSQVFGRFGPRPTRHRVGGKAKHNGADCAFPDALARGFDFRLRCHDVIPSH